MASSWSDPDLERVRQCFGDAPNWRRPPGFATLIHIILEQQVSLASAQAAFDKLCEIVSPLTPQGFLSLDDAALKNAFFSRQKLRYSRELANAIVTGKLELEALESRSDDEVRQKLTSIPGIGPWTADIYLMMALGREDIFPVGDLALAIAVQEIKGLAVRPKPSELSLIAEAWRPERSSAARLLWHYYLSR